MTSLLAFSALSILLFSSFPSLAEAFQSSYIFEGGLLLSLVDIDVCVLVAVGVLLSVFSVDIIIEIKTAVIKILL